MGARNCHCGSTTRTDSNAQHHGWVAQNSVIFDLLQTEVYFHPFHGPLQLQPLARYMQMGFITLQHDHISDATLLPTPTPNYTSSGYVFSIRATHHLHANSITCCIPAPANVRFTGAVLMLWSSRAYRSKKISRCNTSLSQLSCLLSHLCNRNAIQCTNASCDAFTASLSLAPSNLLEIPQSDGSNTA